MQRDMDLARQILLNIENDQGSPQQLVKLELPGYSTEAVAYHVMLLSEAGLIEAQDMGSINTFDFQPRSLTWYGHEFLDAARNDTLWESAKSKTLATTGGLSLDLLRAVLIDLARKALDL